MAHRELEKVLAQIGQDRRGFFKTLLLGTGVALAAVPLMTTASLAQKEGEDPGAGGKCDDGLVVDKSTGKCAKKKG